jgi:uncharacterized cupredoxin-like copper-binding protein
MSSTRSTRARRTLGAVLVAGLLVGTAACGSDDDETAADDTTTTAPADDTAGTGGDEGDEGDDTGDAEGDHIEVTAVDFAFEGLPSEINAGTRLSLVNTAEMELHELVAIRLPDEETRSVEELMALPPDEIEALMMGAEPATVLLAEPGGEQIPAVGDGTLTEPGRYVILCAIPSGIDPAEYLAAAAASPGGPPEIEGAGPPHIVHGMYAELTVVA